MQIKPYLALGLIFAACTAPNPFYGISEEGQVEDAGQGSPDFMGDDASPDLRGPDYPSCAGIPLCDGVSCCEDLAVPGGVFFRSNDVRYPATVSAFRLDRFEITVGRARRVAEAITQGWRPEPGSGAPPNAPELGWDPSWPLAPIGPCGPGSTWDDQNSTIPMNCLDYYQAKAICAFDGKRLPTEAEWNFAAAGGNEHRPWPGGDTPAKDTALAPANLNAEHARWGHYSMAGSVWEWVQDAFGDYPATCDDCVISSPALPSNRVIRGGSHSSTTAGQETAQRSNAQPFIRDNSSGARCANER